MKTIKLITIILFGCFCKLYSQEKPKLIFGQKKYHTKTVHQSSGIDLTPKPSEKSQNYKIEIPQFTEDVSFSLYLKEYTKTKEVFDDYSTIVFGSISKKTTTKFDLALDYQDKGFFKLFGYFHGFSAFRQKFTHDNNSKFKVYRYEDIKNEAFSQKIPLLLICEDESAADIEGLISKYSKNNLVSANPKKTKNLYAQLSHYYIIYYTASKSGK